jgi:hypothetical protein
MRITRAAACAAAVVALAVSSLALPSTASAARHSHDAEAVVLASGLQGSVGSTIGPDGALYVPEADLGTVTRIDTRTGEKSTFATGLPKSIIGLGGAIDIAFRGDTAYVLVSVVGPDVGGTDVDGIYRVDDADSFTVIADLGSFSAAHLPDYPVDLTHGLQYALEPIRGGFLVTDGHHNRVLKVSRHGEVSEAAVFDNIVPTGLTVSHRTVYLAEAGPVPYAPETGKIVKFGIKNPVATDVAAGYSLLTDVAFGRGGLYAISQGDSPGDVAPGSPALPNSGELLRVNHDGTFSVVVDGLDLPTSVNFSRDTAYIVTLGGDVLKVTGVSRCGRGHGRR